MPDAEQWGTFAALGSAAVALMAAVAAVINVQRQITVQKQLHADLLSHQRTLEEQKNQRAIDVATAERLRHLYGDMLDAVDAWCAIAGYVQARYKGESEDERQAVLVAEMKRAGEKVNVARIALELEANTDPVLDIVERAQQIFLNIRIARDVNEEDRGAVPWHEIHDSIDKLNAQRPRLRELAKQHLAILSTASSQATSKVLEPIDEAPASVWAQLGRWRRG